MFLTTISPWLIYIILKLDTFHGFFEAIIFTAGILLFSCLIIRWTSEESIWDQKGFKITNTLSWVAFACAILGKLFVPTTKEIAAIYLIPNFYNSDVIQSDIPEIYEMGFDKVKEILQPKIESPN